MTAPGCLDDLRGTDLDDRVLGDRVLGGAPRDEVRAGAGAGAGDELHPWFDRPAPIGRHDSGHGIGQSVTEILARLSAECGEAAPDGVVAGATRRQSRHTPPREDMPPAGLTGPLELPARFGERTLADGLGAAFAHRPAPGDKLSPAGVLASSPRGMAAALSVGMLGAATAVTGVFPAVGAALDGPTMRLAVADFTLPADPVNELPTLEPPAVDSDLPAVGDTMQTALGQAGSALPAAFERADTARIAALQKAAEEKAAEERTAAERTRERARRAGTIGGAAEAAIGAVTGSNVGERALAIARGKLGTPYVYGAAGPNAFDCSGLTYWAFKQAGVTLPRTSAAQSTFGTPVSKANLQPGDLVFFYKPVSHVGIYIGGGKILHASTSGQPVKISDMSSFPFAGARRV